MGARGHKDRVEVGDRAGRDDVAADAGHVADLLAGKPAQVLLHGLQVPRLRGVESADEVIEGLLHVRERGRGADDHLRVGRADGVELRHVDRGDADVVALVLELDLDADLRVADDDARVRVLMLQLEHLVQGGGSEPLDALADKGHGVQRLCRLQHELRREDRLLARIVGQELGGVDKADLDVFLLGNGRHAIGAGLAAAFAGALFALAAAAVASHDVVVVGGQFGLAAAAGHTAALAGAGVGVALILAAVLAFLARALLGERMEAGQDGAVACAAAQIALEGALDLLHGRVRVVAQEGVHRHDDARSAEAALRAVGLGHALLHGVQPRLGATNTLDRRHGHVVDGANRGEAGVDGAVNDFLLEAVKVRDHHGARAAATLGAAKLGAGETQFVAQEVQQGPFRVDGGQNNLPAVDKHAERQGGIGLQDVRVGHRAGVRVGVGMPMGVAVSVHGCDCSQLSGAERRGRHSQARSRTSKVKCGGGW
eukprot:m.172310 g.172310  ORF g.172310 m.172310 type:complete len:484 (+) comp17291_c0_seq1:3307-4758(+)